MPTHTSALPLHDALPISHELTERTRAPEEVPDDQRLAAVEDLEGGLDGTAGAGQGFRGIRDRKSTRLNSSHLVISYAVFCLKIKEARQPNRRTEADLACI